jgi:hypothetical protein
MGSFKFNRNISHGAEYKTAQSHVVMQKKDAFPTRDSRYPAYAATTTDARFVTDYRPQCSKNIQTGLQYNTKQWMIHHSDSIINQSRRRQVEWTGASLDMANTVPPPANIVHATPFYSEIVKTHLKGGVVGIGVERANSKAPELFGTFKFEPTMNEIQNNRKNIATTTIYEGGRNSPRGIF